MSFLGGKNRNCTVLTGQQWDELESEGARGSRNEMAFLLCCRCSIFTSPKFKSYSYTSSSSSSSSSMDSPPQGYRRNVGICLINPSKKVYYISLSLCSVHGFLSVYVELTCKFFFFIFFFGLWQIFSASRLDIPSAWQMPQVIFSFFFGFILRPCNFIVFLN